MTGRLLIVAGAVLAIALGAVAGYLSAERSQPVVTAQLGAQETTPPAPALPVPAKALAQSDDAATDQAKYGPDWPVCRDMGNDPRLRQAACTRLLDRNVLSILHQSWAYNNRGTAHRRLGRMDLAMKDFRLSLRLSPDNSAPYVNLASIANDFNRAEEALALIDKAIALKPSDTNSYCVRAQTLEVLGRIDEGLASIDKAEEIAPLSDCALLTRAGLLEKKGDKEGALATLAKVGRDKKMASRAMCERGELMTEQGDSKAAFKAYSDALQLDPTNSCAALQASYMALYATEPADALSFVEATIKMRPDLPELHCYRGATLKAIGKPKEALAAYNQVIAAAPNETCGYEYRAVMSQLAGDLGSALADLEVVVRLAPDRTSAWRGHGDILAKFGRWDDAIASYSHAIELDPADLDALAARGDVRFSLQAYAEAALDFAAVLERAPDREIRRRFGEASLAAGAPQDAITVCEKLPADHPESAGCHIILARAYLLSEQTAAAFHELNTISADSNLRFESDVYVIALNLMSGDIAAAQRDAAAFRTAHPNALYGALWTTLIAAATDEAQPADVVALSRTNDIWPTPLLRWLVGGLDEDGLMAAAETPDPRLSQQRRSEAEFYRGLMAFLDGDEQLAAKRFRAAADAGYVVISKQMFPALYQHSNGREVTLAAWMLAGLK